MSAGAWEPSQPGLRRKAVSSGLRWLDKALLSDVHIEAGL